MSKSIRQSTQFRCVKSYRGVGARGGGQEQKPTTVKHKWTTNTTYLLKHAHDCCDCSCLQATTPGAGQQLSVLAQASWDPGGWEGRHLNQQQHLPHDAAGQGHQ